MNEYWAYCADPKYLSHFGINGMKWGVRRFQNRDGTRTAAGKKRYQTDSDSEPKKAGIGRALEQNIPQGKGKPNISPAERISKNTENIAKQSGDIVSSVQRIADRRASKKQAQEDLSGFSNAELRERVNRINLENQYRQLTRKDTQEGFERAKDVIAIVGGTAAIVTSGLTIASEVRKLRNGG